MDTKRDKGNDTQHPFKSQDIMSVTILIGHFKFVYMHKLIARNKVSEGILLLYGNVVVSAASSNNCKGVRLKNGMSLSANKTNSFRSFAQGI